VLAVGFKLGAVTKACGAVVVCPPFRLAAPRDRAHDVSVPETETEEKPDRYRAGSLIGVGSGRSLHPTVRRTLACRLGEYL